MSEHTPEAEKLADAVLRAAGSGLRHYSLPSNRTAILNAAQNGIDAVEERASELIEAVKTLSQVSNAIWVEWKSQTEAKSMRDAWAAVDAALTKARTGSAS